MELILDTSHPLFAETSNGNYPIFFTPQYANFLKLQNQSLALVYNTELKALMPIRIWKSKLLNYVTCLFRPLCHEGHLSLQQETIFLNQFVEFIKSQNLADRISAPENFSVFQTAPDASLSVGFGTYLLDLFPNVYGAVFQNFQPRYRSAINNAEKIGVTIKYGIDYIHDFYQLHRQTMVRSNMYIHPISYFEAYLMTMPEYCHLAVAYINDVPIGAVLILYSTYSAYYLYGCSSENTFASGAIKYLHANAMQIMIGKGVRQYDFVGARLSDISGTRLQGIQDFKSRFGTRLESGRIWKMDVHPFKCRIADGLLYLKIKLSNGSMSSDIIDQERLKC